MRETAAPRWETDELGEPLGDMLLHEGEDWRDLVYVDVGVEDGEEELRDDTDLNVSS